MFTSVEVEFLTPGEFMGGMLRNVNPSYALPDFSNVEIGEVIIDGDTEEFELVLEDGNWKIDDGMNFM